MDSKKIVSCHGCLPSLLMFAGVKAYNCQLLSILMVLGD